jgi:hypothetical protein
MPNSYDYYNDSSQWGDYQYITLDQVVNNFLASRDDDDYTGNVPRYRVLYHARRGLREFYYDVLREIQAIELELSQSLMVTLPPDYVNYVRISWVNENNELVPMAMDGRIKIAKEYLQDHEYNLLFDDTGCVLEGSGDPIYNPDAASVLDSSGDNRVSSYYAFCDNGFQPNRNMSDVYTSGKFAIDKNKGVIVFGSEVFGKKIVLEYISDGLYTGCEGRPEAEIRVNKFAESALLDFIYYELIKKRRHVPLYEKKLARKEYYNNRRIAKRRINTLRKSELIQAFKGSSKWIK